MEIDFTANGGHAEAVAIAADTGDHAGDDVAGALMLGHAEAQGVHGRNRTGPHGEDIAQNAADAGGRALIGFDVGGVVVALHLEDNGLTIVNVDHPGILTGALQHARTFGRQGAEPFL